MSKCPSCQREVDETASECHHCGIIFAKWHARQVSGKKTEHIVKRQRLAKKGVFIIIGSIILVAAVLFGIDKSGIMTKAAEQTAFSYYNFLLTNDIPSARALLSSDTVVGPGQEHPEKMFSPFYISGSKKLGNNVAVTIRGQGTEFAYTKAVIYVTAEGLGWKVRNLEMHYLVPGKLSDCENYSILNSTPLPAGKLVAVSPLDPSALQNGKALFVSHTMFLRPGKELFEAWKIPEPSKARLDFSPDGKYLAAAGLNDSIIRVWNTSTWSATAEIKSEHAPTDIACTKDGAWILVANDYSEVEYIKAGDHPSLSGSYPTGLSGNSMRLAASPTSLFFVVATDTGQISFWNLGSKEHGAVDKVAKGDDPAFGLSSVCVSPSAPVAAAATVSGELAVYDLKSGAGGFAEVHPAKYKAGVNDISFSPDGSKIAVCFSDGTVSVLDIETLRPVFTDAFGNAASRAVFSTDGRFLAAGNLSGEGRLYDMGSMRLISELDKVEGGIFDLCFSPDGKYLAASSAEKGITLWSCR